MAYLTNPFLERMSERTTSDLDFVRLFSPNILERLAEESFKGGVHVIRSAPGAGKTTLLRAFTPSSLRGFWASRKSPELEESFQRLVSLGILQADSPPRFLGVLLSCASGYADLPPGVDIKQEGLFRALLDCRIVLKTIRNLGILLNLSKTEDFEKIELDYSEAGEDLKGIPQLERADQLVDWAEKYEKRVYAKLDAFVGDSVDDMPSHHQFEGVIWLQTIQFRFEGNLVAPDRLLMIDDLHKLRRRQRSLLIDELAVQRLPIPVWLAERTIVLGDALISQGVRKGRDVHEFTLEELWSGSQGTHQFMKYAQSILDRRMVIQDLVPSQSFSQCLRQELVYSDIKDSFAKGISLFKKEISALGEKNKYKEWIDRAEQKSLEEKLETLYELYVTLIFVAREEKNKQMSFDMVLPVEKLEEKDASRLRSAAEVFMHKDLKIPYYFGIERLCRMSSSNVEELLSLSASLYAGMKNKQILRKHELILSPAEQESLLKSAAKQKYEFIPKSHTEGLYAQRLLNSISQFCADKTFVRNAPIAPGVTGIRLSASELGKLTDPSDAIYDEATLLTKVISECAAENLLIARQSAASASRDSGTIFYLNRSLCSMYDLPLQLGGWKDVQAIDLIGWMRSGYSRSRRLL